MLVLFSDVHLTDGRTAINPHETAFELLAKDLVVSARDKKARELEFVMLGDVFDLVRTDYWHEHVPSAQRPWGGSALDPDTGMNRDVDLLPQFAAILQEILATPAAGALVQMVKTVGGEMGLPPRVVYVVGNHDRVFHNYPGLRSALAAAFAPVPVEFRTVFQSEEYGVWARHGHEWDEHCHGWDFLRKVLRKGTRVGRFDDAAYRVMAIGEVVTAELMGGLLHGTRQRLTSPGDQPFLRRLLNVNNLRPMTEVFHWLSWLAREEEDRYTTACSEALRDALDAVLGSTFARRWDAVKADLIVSGDLTDFLQLARRALGDKRGIERLRKVLPLLDKVNIALAALKGSQDHYEKGASEEVSGLPAAVQYILYGHTHQARQRCLSAQLAGAARVYLNTGTFVPVIDRAADGSFFDSNRMTYVCVYKADEDTAGRADLGPTLDVWDGMKRKNYLP